MFAISHDAQRTVGWKFRLGLERENPKPLHMGTKEVCACSMVNMRFLDRELVVGILRNAIKTAVISTLGAKLARGRSPIVGALIALLLSRAIAGKTDEQKPDIPGTENGLSDLVERFRQGGLEEVIKSWIGTGANKPVSPEQLHHALGSETVDGLTRETGLPREDLLSQLSRLLPTVIDNLTPNGKLPDDNAYLSESKLGDHRDLRNS